MARIVALTSVVVLTLWWCVLVAEAVEEGYQEFRVSRGQQQKPRSGHLYPWEQSVEWSKSLPQGGVGLKLVHRDEWDSPLIRPRSASSIGSNRLQRDRARVQALNQRVAIPSSGGGTPGPPLRSPIISGLAEGSGEYFTRISFGSPSSDVLVTIDTGSDLLWIQCHPCDKCYVQVGPIFNPGESHSYDPIHCYSEACETLAHSKCSGVTCQYDVSYGDGSFTTGEFARETLTLNNTKSKPFMIHDFYFGCGHDNEGLFIASAGLLGLGRGPLSFPSQLSRVLSPRFSYCLTDRFALDGPEPSDSFLYFGEPETSHMKFTPLLHNPAAPTFYYVQLTGISVARQQLQIPTSEFEMDSAGRGGVILDTGTSVSRLPTVAYKAMRDEFREKLPNLQLVDVPGQDLFDTCFRIDEDQTVPTITLHFSNDVDMVLPADNVLIPVDETGELFCLAFAGSDGRANLSIIGNVQQQGFRIEFDLSAKARVGFTRVDCSPN
ncbi:aspartyl protease family protein [Marchantia polymorpha subsp. ruderalis]|nr:hypothetical protein MARPO_0003s0250 [Marchantia polymorpha]BBN17154.1 hypothetical protein Mp_7g12400 [Marchantia polymorpha subsp. ruderalis]BBN17155.1 hypothetical protein Mp_7g12410 [Marchantia polymorpha subsp. ruderalis]|eukprot:PTQ49390.1 hypothetical protein MARPO_0003s0250 [Marchantia polymorpha]